MYIRSKWYSYFIPTTFISIGLFVIASVIVLSLLPLYIPTRNLSIEDSYSSLLNLNYNIPRSLVPELSGNTMVLRTGNLTDDRIKIFENILQNKLSSNKNFQKLRINVNQVNIQSMTNNRRRRRAADQRSSKANNVIIYQQSDMNSTEFDQLKIFFRLIRRGHLTESFISNVLINIFNQIEFNVTTFLTLFGEDPTISLSSRTISSHVKDSEIIKYNGVRVFGMKDYTGNIQNIYAIQTNNTIYRISNGQIVQIRSLNETLVFNYDNNNNQYKILLVLTNNSYEISKTYDKVNITFPSPIFNYPLNETVPKIFTGILLELNNKINSRTIDDATLVLNYFDVNQNEKSDVMLTMNGGRYFLPLPNNDDLFEKYFNSNKFLTTITEQSDAYLQLFQSYPIVDICSKVPDVSKSFCSILIQEMTVTIPEALRFASKNISTFHLKSQSFGQMTNFTVTAFVPGQQSLTIPLNSSNIIKGKSTARSAITIDPNQLNTISIQIIGTRGQCNEQTVAGNDIPDDRIIEIGKSHTTVTFSYETYVIKDQIEVYYMNKQIFSTGCVGANGKSSFNLDGDESTLRVNVIPDCAGETGTAWYYSFQCTNQLICEENYCYCGLNHQNSQQIKPPQTNGCGGEGSAWNFIIYSLGGLWGFTPACNAHDECYGTCNNHRDMCDMNFQADMTSICSKFLLLPPLFPNCQAWAEVFYLAVHFGGANFFIPAQEQDCNCV
ncbi:unnamed protein product [Adineta ricciae]|uniref:Uncharacterized protein n=1 Tax=Adineta ricciae TaxID=249248 RepID=A0A815AC54_ADIRI|nr:unnamed protein product [Adineta ricciae]